jgi:high affinity Mn2+ porin
MTLGLFPKSLPLQALAGALLALGALPGEARAQAPAAVETPDKTWTLHAQSTYVLQMNPSFHSPYQGMDSFDPNQESRHTVSFTLFLGHTLWPGASLYYDPEFTQGEGLSDTTGIADFPNGEGSRASSVNPQYDTARLFIREVVNLGGARSRMDDDQNQVPSGVSEDRLIFTAGKISVPDIFDNNAYSHDARTQFLNWALVDDGAWDYPADGKGYTGGFAAEWAMATRTLRYGIFMEPQVANALPLDDRVDKAFGQVLEWEERYQSDGHPAAIRFLAFWNRAHMGLYQAALEESSPPDITLSREYRSKTGAGLNWEQEITDGLGAFARVGFDDGRTETWAYTEIDESVSGGFALSGKRWGRADDTLGIAGVASGLSSDHKRYLQAGGYGFIVGDGRLNYEAERVAEAYYSFRAAKWLTLSLDYQFVEDPGYNRDRGPVSVFGLRAHAEY